MIVIKADMCDSCKEIYNKSILKRVEIVGDFHIDLCPDCYIAFCKRYKVRGATNEV